MALSGMDKVHLNSVAVTGSDGSGSKVSSVGNAGAVVADVKEEPSDIMGSLVNMKKEETFSPNMSPVGFGSIGSIGPSGSNAPDRSDTPGKNF